MSGGGSDAPPPASGPSNGGEFLLSLFQRPYHLNHAPESHGPLPRQQQPLPLDPALAAVGPSRPLPLRGAPSGGHDSSFPWPQGLSAPGPSLPYPNKYAGHQDELARLGMWLGPDSVTSVSSGIQNLRFGAFSLESEPPDRLPNGYLIESRNFDTVAEREVGLGSRGFEKFDRNPLLIGQESPDCSNSSSNASVFGQRNADCRSFEQPRIGHHPKYHMSSNAVDNRLSAPPGFQREAQSRGFVDQRRGVFDHKAGEVSGDRGDFKNINILNSGGGIMRSRGFQLDGHSQVRGERVLVGPLDGKIQSPHSSNVDKSVGDAIDTEAKAEENAEDFNDLSEQLVDSLLIDDPLDEKKNKNLRRPMRDKEYRSDPRGQQVLNQRMRNLRRMMDIRGDIHRMNNHFLQIYESLIPPEEEKARQKQLLTMLERLVNKEWPEARLYLYGSCANSFGVCKSDIDLCLAIQDPEMNKSEVLEKLADILKLDNLQNVQALVHARVPIVKLMDPVTELSCDICINNVLAVINTKLLRDYAQMDIRLLQLTYIVKHWAKSRRVNETYQGTLSSYAYVLMCINFLQQRRPAILPCLQELKPTYSVIVDGIECTYFDQVEMLRDYGSRNRETISQLVWAFFNYWAYRHDYTHSVISVRAGCLLSKQAKDWTRRIGNERHLICIEDPFDTKHDLGRVVDKFSIKVLREEFERAAEIMQHDPNPWVTLFEPYAPS